MTDLKLDPETLKAISELAQMAWEANQNHQVLLDAFRELNYAASVLRLCLDPPKMQSVESEGLPHPCPCGCPTVELIRICGDSPYENSPHESFVGCPRCGRKASVLKSYRYAAEKWNLENPKG